MDQFSRRNAPFRTTKWYNLFILHLNPLLFARQVIQYTHLLYKQTSTFGMKNPTLAEVSCKGGVVCFAMVYTPSVPSCYHSTAGDFSAPLAAYAVRFGRNDVKRVTEFKPSPLGARRGGTKCRKNSLQVTVFSQSGEATVLRAGRWIAEAIAKARRMRGRVKTNET